MKYMVWVLAVCVAFQAWVVREQSEEAEHTRYLVTRLAQSVDDLSREVRKLRDEAALAVEAKEAAAKALEACSEMEMRVGALEEGVKRQAEASKAAEVRAGRDLELVSRALQSKFGPESWFYLINEAKVQASVDAWGKVPVKSGVVVTVPEVKPEPGGVEPMRDRWEYR